MNRTSSIRILGRNERTYLQMGAIFLLTILVFAPLASAGIGGTITGNVYNSNGYTLGESQVDLYNFVGVDTKDTRYIHQSNWLSETEKSWNTVTPTTGNPSGIPDSQSVFSDSWGTNTPPPGLVLSPSDQTDDAGASNEQPTGTSVITPQIGDTTATNTNPVGSAPIIPQQANTLATNTAPLGTTASINAQIDDSSATNTPPSGTSAAIAAQVSDATATNTKPAGLSDSTPQSSDSRVIFVQPTGSAAISANSADAGSTPVQPSGSPASQSGLWYTGALVVDADDDGGVDDTIFWVLTDTGVSGIYDTMDLSYDITNYNDGTTTDQYVGPGDDEHISDGETVTLGTYDFIVNFASDPSTASPDVWIASKEWFTGSFNIDLDGDGTIAAGELVYYSMADTDSNGNYETLDLSSDDSTFGEGVLTNAQTGVDDDERVSSGAQIRFATHNFAAGFSTNPASDNPDVGILSFEWYTGTLGLDWFPELGADGLLDFGVLSFAISDRNSDGVFDRVDITENYNNPDFQEGGLLDGIAMTGNDEYSTVTASEGTSVTLGSHAFNISFNSAPASGDPDFWIRSNTWYSDSISLEGTSYEVGSSDIDSNGLYDRFYIDLSLDSDFNDAGEGPFQTSDTITDGSLSLDYSVTTIYSAPLWAPNYIAQITPEGATLPSSATDWQVGTINLGGTDYATATSDYDGAPGYEAVEFDLNSDKALDIMGDDGSDGSPFGFTVGGGIYYSIWVDQNDVRVLPNPWSPGLLPTFDYNNDVMGMGGSGVYYYGIIQEAVLGELNGDFDFGDEFEVVVVDMNDDGTYDACYIDHDDDNNMGNGGGFGPGGSYWPGMPVWPMMGVSLLAIQPDGQQITLSAGPVATGSSVTVSESTPVPLSRSDRYISTGSYELDPTSAGMTTPSNLNQNGAATVIPPSGISMNTMNTLDSSSTGTQPTGSASITSSDFNAGTTNIQPPGAPWSQSVLWYFGTLLLDCDGDGVADDIVNWVLTDVMASNVYDVLSLSYDWAWFGDGDIWNGYLDSGEDEWIFIGPANIQFETYTFAVSFDPDPDTDGDDARITSTTWFQGIFNIDANDDADAIDYIYYALSDTDSDGVYETLDLSCEDVTFGEGTLGNGIVDYAAPGNNLDDERITTSSDVTLGDSFLFTVSFDGGPLVDSDDARIQSKEWYEGTFTLDADDDGMADDTVNYAISDMNSDGLYDTWDLSLDDTTFEEGALTDGDVTNSDNDERIQTALHDNFDGVSMGSPTWDTPLGAAPFVEWNRISANPYLPLGPLQNPVNEYHSGSDSYWCGAPNVNDPATGWATPPGIGSDWDEELKLLSVDLSTASTATLTFEHYFSFPDTGWDGGTVYISTLGQFGPWTVITPDGGYPGSNIMTGEPQYDKSNNEWTQATFDLSGYAGDTIWLRWKVIETLGWNDQDGAMNGDGWFIDDVTIHTGRYVTIGPSFEFLAEFDIAPNIDGNDARVLSNTWHEGSFLIDGNGDGFVFEMVRYVLTDTDSDGVYEAMDLSIDDVNFGEGNLNDNFVNWFLFGNDERITVTDDLTLGSYFLFTCEFDGGPNMDADDARITSKEWYESSFIIDSDGDGLASEDIYFVLTDTDSDGAYEAMDISMNTTYGEGNLADNIVDSSGSGNDELITGSTDLTLGDYYLFMTGFDVAPNWIGSDARIRSEEWYEGNFTIDGDDSGAADETVSYVLSDTNSDGLYDTMDISIDDGDYGEGGLSDSFVNWESLGNDERISILILDQFDGSPIGSPTWLTQVGSSGFIEWNQDTSQGQFTSGSTSYWCGAPNVNDPAAWGPGSTPPGYGLNWDEELKLDAVDITTANDATLTFNHYYNTETTWDGGALYISTTGQFGPWTLITPEEGYDGSVFSLGNDGYTGNSGGWSQATFDLNPYVGNTIWLRWRLTEDGLWCDQDGGWDGDGWFIDDVKIVTNRYITLGTSYEFIVNYDFAPNTDSEDADITSNEWYLGDWVIDADNENDDGVADDTVEYVLTDTDSDGLYDTMDISINDDVFGETGGGGLSDFKVDYDWDGNNLDDERITASENVTLGDSLMFNIEFDANPNNVDSNDARINSIEWYEGTFSIDLDGDGTVDPDSVNYVLSDISSWGLYMSYMDISVDDTTYGEGAIIDQTATTDNDELVWVPGGEYVWLGAYNYHVQSYDQLFDGFDVNDGVNYDARDVKLRINHWFWGSALLEGNTRYAVVADSDSDGVFDEIYIDVDDNDNWGDVGVDAIGVPVGGTFQGSELELQYTVTYIDPQGQYFEIQPTGASVGSTTSWFVGQIEIPFMFGNWYDVVLSDTDNDGTFETADFDNDMPGDSVVDVTGITETSGLVPFWGEMYQVINIHDSGWNVRMVSYVDAVLGPANDISLTGLIHYGEVSEAALTLNLNQDGDMSDIFHTIVVDNIFFDVYQTVFIDTDSDDDLSTETPLTMGSAFSISSPPPMIDHEYDIDYVEPMGDFYAFKQTNHPVDTFYTSADGFYSLSTSVNGNYWIKVSNSGSSWGYGNVWDTNSGSGISLTKGDTIDDWNEYLGQTGSFIFGYVNDSLTLNPIDGAQVEIYDSAGSLVVSTQTHADGSYQLAVVPSPGYDLVYSYPGYYTDDGRGTGTWQDLLVVGDTYSKDVLLVPDTVPPSITLNYPQEGTTVSGIETVAVTASDDFLLDAVEVSFDLGAIYHTMTWVGGNNYAYVWDTTAYAEGQYRVTVRATDNAQLTDSKFVDVYVSNDATPPTVSIVSPSDNDFIEGTYTIQILALDNHALQFVNVSVGGVDYQATYNAITGYYEHPLDTTAYGDGLSSLDARATDYGGNFAVDVFPTGVNIDNSYPSLWINTPADGETVYDLVNIDCHSVDAGAYVPTVEYKIDSGSWTSLSGSEIAGWTDSWDSTGHSNGIHTIHVRSYDGAGHITLDSVTVTVDNDDPSVSVVAPLGNEDIQGTYTFCIAASDEVTLTNVFATIDVTNHVLGYNSASGYWEVSIDTTTLPEGVHSITATAEDGIPAHTQTTVAVFFTVDNLEPVLSINLPTNGETVWGSSVTIDADCYDEGPSVPWVGYRIDSGPWITLAGSEPAGWTATWDSTSVSNGAHTLTFRGSDTIGHVVTDSVDVIVDNDNPTVNIVAPIASEYVQGTYAFKVAATDEIQVSSVYITINAVNYLMGYNSASGYWEVTVDTTTIVDGTWGITATVSDGVPAHTQTSPSFDFDIDNNAPTLSVNSPSDGETLTGALVVVDVDSTDSGSFSPTVQYRVDSGPWVTLTGSEVLGWTGSWDSTTVSDGAHTLRFRAYDGIGHLTTDSIGVTVDNNGPSVSIVAPVVGEYIQDTYTFKVTASDSLGVTNVYITINGIDHTTGYNSASGFWEIVIDSDTISDGTYSITATAKDRIPGHEQTSTPFEFSIDNHAPALSINYPTNGLTVYGNAVSVDVGSIDTGVFVPTVQYRVDRGAWITLAGDEIAGWTDSWDTTVHSNMGHTLTVRSYDAIGHIVSETIDLTIDNDNPLVSIVAPISGEFIHGTYSFKIAASDEIGVTNVHITIGGVDYTAGYNSASGYWEVDIDSITLVDGGYSITATAKDGIPIHTQTTSATSFNVDNTPPALTINFPVPGQHVRGDITFNVLGSDTFLDKVEYSVDGTGWVAIGTAWDSTIFKDGLHTITFRVVDLAAHVTQETIEVIIDNKDTDSDGIGDMEDPDIDGDGWNNDVDAFPYDDTEWIDTDGDGIGNNADTDDDGDGVLDNLDDFPLNPNEWVDTDSDGYGDNVDFDDDNDGILDLLDPFSKDSSEWIDTDGDGIGDNVDLDDDGDGVIDTEDDFPKNPEEYVDTDLDGVGDNADADDDGDGVIDEHDDFPLDPTETIDTDSDGIGNNADSDDDNDGVPDTEDAFPLDPNEYLDTDSDGVGDTLDNDIDGDGVMNVNDAFPVDATEYIDTDGDGIGDNTDLDDDGDNILDINDLFPLNFREYLDTDADGIGDAADIDDDGDLVPDFNDAFPLDPSETTDLDLDGIGDNSDTDRDGDGFENSVDAFPDDIHEWADTDKDGIGNNADPDDDNDGVADLSDYAPLDRESNLPPFWWWWIPFAALLCLAILVYFMTNRRRAGTLPDEESLKKKFKDIPEETYDRPLPSEKIRAPAISRSSIPVVYTASELEGMKKSQLIRVAKEMGLSIAGTKTELTTRINVAQANTTMEGIMQTLEDFDCPSCGKTLRVETKEAPLDIQCPHCETSGTID